MSYEFSVTKRDDEIVLSCHEGSGLSTHSVFPDLRLSLLDHIIFRSPLIVMRDGTHYSSLPSLIPFLRPISSLSPVRLTLQFQLRFVVRFGWTVTVSQDWSDIAAVLVLPIFRYPIELYLNHIDDLQTSGALFADAVSSLEKHSDVKKLLGDGELAIIKGENFPPNRL